MDEGDNNMKMSIKKKYFDQIKEGKTEVELRDAHITFICEETGETLIKKVWASDVIFKHHAIETKPTLNKEEVESLFDDDKLIVFELE